MTENEQIEEMAKSCPWYQNGKCKAGSEHPYAHVPCDCDLNCELYSVLSNLIGKGYRKVKRGEWEEINDGIAETVYRCTVCNEEFYFESGVTIYANFCPHCGADMRGKEE